VPTSFALSVKYKSISIKIDKHVMEYTLNKAVYKVLNCSLILIVYIKVELL